MTQNKQEPREFTEEEKGSLVKSTEILYEMDQEEQKHKKNV